MKKVEQGEGGNITRLEDEIRKLGVPYVSPEPDQQYWGSFRMRTMGRIAEKESKSIASLPGRIKTWIGEHIMGSGLIGAAAAALIAVAIVNPFHEAAKVPVAHPQIAQVAPAPPTAPAIVPTPAVPQQVKHAIPQDKWMAANLNDKKIRHMSQMAMLDKRDAASRGAEETVGQPTIMGTESDYPVSLNELTAPELESVLHGLQGK